jgi:hypothetical protein
VETLRLFVSVHSGVRAVVTLSTRNDHWDRDDTS